MQAETAAPAEYLVNLESQVIAARVVNQGFQGLAVISRGLVEHRGRAERLASRDFLALLERRRPQVQVDSQGPAEHQEQPGLREHLGRQGRAEPVARRGRVVKVARLGLVARIPERAGQVVRRERAAQLVQQGHRVLAVRVALLEPVERRARRARAGRRAQAVRCQF